MQSAKALSVPRSVQLEVATTTIAAVASVIVFLAVTAHAIAYPEVAVIIINMIGVLCMAGAGFCTAMTVIAGLGMPVLLVGMALYALYLKVRA